MERAKRKQAIVSRVGRYGPCLTAQQIATGEGLSKSPHLVNLLEEMTNEGLLVVQWATHTNRQATRYFSLPGQAPCLL